MGKFVDRAIQLLSEGKHDELQTELYDLEKAYKLCNKLRESLQESNHRLVETNTRLVLEVAKMQGDRSRIIKDGEEVAKGLNEQMDRTQVERQAELQSIVEDNVRLKVRVKQLEQNIRRLQRSE